MLAIAVIAVTSWVLDVAADAPSLASCKPIDKRRQLRRLRRRRHASSGVIASPRSPHAGLDRADPEEPAAGDGGDRGPALLRARRRSTTRASSAPRSRTSKPAKRSRAARRSPSSWSATSASRNPKRNLERKIVEAKLAIEYAERHSRQEILGSYLNIASYGTIEGTHRGRGRRRREDLLLEAGLEADAARRRRCWPGCRRRPPNTTRSSTRGAAQSAAQRGAAADGEARLRQPTSGRGRRCSSGLGLDVSDELLRAPPALLLRLRREQADRASTGSTRCAAAASRCRRRSTRSCSRSAWKRCARPCPTRPTPPRRWSRSTPATATSGRWSPAPTTPRASSTSPPRATASPARPSRPSS